MSSNHRLGALASASQINDHFLPSSGTIIQHQSPSRGPGMTVVNLSAVLRRLARQMGAESLADQSDRQLVERALAGRDGPAFEAIVRRHGSMVYRVCWRVLQQPQDAEDAFQATFLVLVQNLRSLRKHASLASWLHGVAQRVASKAKRQSAIRRRREALLPVHESAPPQDITWKDLRAALDAELSQMPEQWRLPLILCYLEGRTQDEAANQLGWSKSKLRRLLEKGRTALRRRLAGHGITAPAALSALLFSDCLASAEPAAGLVTATAEAAAGIAAGKTAAVVTTAKVAVLTEGMVKAMFVAKLKTVMSLVLLLGGVALGGGLLTLRTASGQPGQAATAEAQEPAIRAAPPDKQEPVVAKIGTGQSRHVTANFVVIASSEAIARTIGARAEAERKRLAVEWLGLEAPAWKNPCLIHVRIGTGQASGSVSFKYEERQPFTPEQKISLVGPLDDLLKDALPQQVTRTLLAHDLGAGYPRWVEAGTGIMAQSERTRNQCLASLPGQNRLRLARLFALRDYPGPNELETFNAQSLSVCEFLVARKDRMTFLAFVQRGMQRGWDDSLKRYYGFDGVADFEAVWQQSVTEAKVRPEPGVRITIPMIDPVPIDLDFGIGAGGAGKPASVPAPAAISGEVLKVQLAELSVSILVDTDKQIVYLTSGEEKKGDATYRLTDKTAVLRGDSTARMKFGEIRAGDRITVELNKDRSHVRQLRVLQQGRLDSLVADEVTTIDRRSFSIPIRINPRMRHEIKRLYLYRSTDKGKNWTEINSGLPEELADGFKVTVTEDGIYWFALTFQDKDGRFVPDWRKGELRPQLKVRVDTSKGEKRTLKWRTDYAQARKEAAEKNLPLLLLFHGATPTADPCPDAETKALINEKYIPVMLDRESEVGKYLGIQHTPTIVLASSDGRVVATVKGRLDRDTLRRLLPVRSRAWDCLGLDMMPVTLEEVAGVGKLVKAFTGGMRSS